MVFLSDLSSKYYQRQMLLNCSDQTRNGFFSKFEAYINAVSNFPTRIPAVKIISEVLFPSFFKNLIQTHTRIDPKDRRAKYVYFEKH